MTPQEKEYIHLKLRDALDAEKISQKAAEKCLGINQAYVSMIKLGTNLKAVPDKIWERIKPWSVSCLPIADFEAGILLHQGNAEPEREPLKVEITTVGDFIDHAQKDLDKAQKEEDAKQEEFCKTKFPDEEPVIPTFEEINAEIEDEKAEQEQGAVLRDFLRKNGSVLRTAEGTEYYFVPFWFKMDGDKPMEIMGLDRLPWEVRMIIKTMGPL